MKIEIKLACETMWQIGHSVKILKLLVTISLVIFLHVFVQVVMISNLRVKLLLDL